MKLNTVKWLIWNYFEDVQIYNLVHSTPRWTIRRPYHVRHIRSLDNIRYFEIKT